MKSLKKKNKKKVIIIIAVILLIYVLFFAYVPWWSDYFYDVEISEKQMKFQCPEVILTDYDYEFLNTLYDDPRVCGLTRSNSFRGTADELGFERYKERPDENYEFSANYYSSIQHAGVLFDYEGGFVKKDLYLSVDEDGSDDNENSERDYYKAISVKFPNGRWIASYRHSHSKYVKTIYVYGLVGHLITTWHGLMSA